MEAAETDASGNLQKVDYTFDVYGDRIEEKTYTGSGSTWSLTSDVKHVYDEGHVYADLDASGTVTARYLVGDDGQLYGRSVVGDDGTGSWAGLQTAWLTQDRLGSVTQVVSADGTTVLDAVDYSGFGVIESETDASQRGAFAFTGLAYSDATGLMHAQWREYAPDLGQWYQEDPKGLLAGDANVRRYVGNDPVNGTDPSGLWLIAKKGSEGTIVADLQKEGFTVSVVNLPVGTFEYARVGIVVQQTDLAHLKAAAQGPGYWQSFYTALADHSGTAGGFTVDMASNGSISPYSADSAQLDVMRTAYTKLIDGAKYTAQKADDNSTWTAIGQGIDDGWTLARNNLTLGLDSEYSAEAARVRAEHRGGSGSSLYFVSDYLSAGGAVILHAVILRGGYALGARGVALFSSALPTMTASATFYGTAAAGASFELATGFSVAQVSFYGGAGLMLAGRAAPAFTQVSIQAMQRMQAAMTAGGRFNPLNYRLDRNAFVSFPAVPLKYVPPLQVRVSPNLDQVPSVRGKAFQTWFDELTTTELNQVWSNPVLRAKVEARLRSPGGFHEWLPVSRP